MLLLVLHSVQVVHAIAAALVQGALLQMWIGRKCKMSANNLEYEKMFGAICNEAVVMARCACVACNSCTCACSCRNSLGLDELDWE